MDGGGGKYSHASILLQDYHFLPVAHTYRSRKTLNGGAGAGAACIHKFCSRMDIFKLIVYCMKSPKFVVTTNWLCFYCRETLWLQLSIFVQKPKSYKSYNFFFFSFFFCTSCVLNNYFGLKHYVLINIIVIFFYHRYLCGTTLVKSASLQLIGVLNWYHTSMLQVQH